jgi:DNA replication and repair protein RecF
MYIESLKLENFRNYKNQNIPFINGINLFLGDNAQGKTNIIEAIYLSAFGKSYRTIKDLELIMFNEKYCHVNLNYNKENTKRKIEFFLDENNKKMIKQNDIKISKISNHVGELLIVLFSPDSLDIVKGSPGKRRKFLDMICYQLSKSYIITHQEYTKYLKLKNTLLKKENIDKEYIEILHDKMSEQIKKIVSFRFDVIEKILKKAQIIQKNITGGKENINLEYKSDFINLTKQEIKKILDENLYIDIIRKSSLKGIQRDDIDIFVNNLDVGKYGSQGQNRTALLTLKLANFEVLIEEKDDVPILLLDDIMSELDSSRIKFLLKYIEKYQSIITTTDASFIKDVKNIQILKVFNATLEK